MLVPVSEQNIAFDKMLEERRKNRKMNFENTKEKEEVKMIHYQHKSAFKPKYSHKNYLEMN